jgi:hypothetical protein
MGETRPKPPRRDCHSATTIRQLCAQRKKETKKPVTVFAKSKKKGRKNPGHQRFAGLAASV